MENSLFSLTQHLFQKCHLVLYSDICLCVVLPFVLPLGLTVCVLSAPSRPFPDVFCGKTTRRLQEGTLLKLYGQSLWSLSSLKLVGFGPS